MHCKGPGPDMDCSQHDMSIVSVCGSKRWILHHTELSYLDSSQHDFSYVSLSGSWYGFSPAWLFMSLFRWSGCHHIPGLNFGIWAGWLSLYEAVLEKSSYLFSFSSIFFWIISRNFLSSGFNHGWIRTTNDGKSIFLSTQGEKVGYSAF